MRFRNIIAPVVLAAIFLMQHAAMAQDNEVSFKRAYWGNSVDGAIFSTSLLSKAVKSDEVTTLRVSSIFHIGVTFNYDFSKSIGLYTGAGIKNIGFIEKDRTVDSTIKRRVYAIEVPLGFKIGKLYARKFIFLGGGADIAFNYKEKSYVRRGNKEKFNEWFSDRTPFVMPFVFVGASFSPGLTAKLQYYPQNFLNADFTDAGGAKPYAGYNVNLILLSLGVDIHHHKKPREEAQDAKNMM